MKLANLAGARFKERPSDCVVDSHALLLRGGYIKQVMNGVFSSYTPLVRVTRKIEQILREEMDALGGQEVELPVVMPASLWQASGRYAKIGPELARFRDRSGNELVLGMTHEEAAVQLVRDEAQSYVLHPQWTNCTVEKGAAYERCKNQKIRCGGRDRAGNHAETVRGTAECGCPHRGQKHTGRHCRCRD